MKREVVRPPLRPVYAIFVILGVTVAGVVGGEVTIAATLDKLWPLPVLTTAPVVDLPADFSPSTGIIPRAAGADDLMYVFEATAIQSPAGQWDSTLMVNGKLLIHDQAGDLDVAKELRRCGGRRRR